LFVTWRLAGTLPQPEPAVLVSDAHPGRTLVRYDRQLDRTTRGPRWLANPQIATLFVDALLHGEGVRRSYDLYDAQSCSRGHEIAAALIRDHEMVKDGIRGTSQGGPVGLSGTLAVVQCIEDNRRQDRRCYNEANDSARNVETPDSTRVACPDLLPGHLLDTNYRILAASALINCELE
jgi:hypothetical protein